MTSMHEAVRPRIEDSRWIRDHADAQEILRSGDFANSLGNGTNRPITADIVLVLTGDVHLARRRTEMVLFNRRAQERYEFEIVEPAIGALLAQATEGTADWCRVDMLGLARTAMVNVSARVIGIDGIGSEQSILELLDLTHKIGETFAIDFSTRPPAQIMDEAIAACDRFVEQYFARSLARRREAVAALHADTGTDSDTGDAGAPPEDLLGLLVRDYPDWSDEQILRECMFYLSASAGTSTHSVPHVIANIAQYLDGHPEHLGRVQELSFLQRSVLETLRLEPPQPALSRVALEDVVLSSGTTIGRGEFLLVDLNAMNREPSVVGARPDDFDPYRTVAARTPRSATSFGTGPHMCPGRIVAVGKGTGDVEDDGRVSGAITRLCQTLFGYDVRIDPANPPTLRTDTRSNRYGSFDILVRRRPVGAEPVVTAR